MGSLFIADFNSPTTLVLAALALAALGVISVFGFDLSTISFLAPVFVLGGDGGAGGGGSLGVSMDPNAAVAKAAALGFTATPGETVGMSFSFSLDGMNVDVSIDAPSCPFLCTWDGKQFKHENDFLFAKPNSAFPNFEAGLAAYRQGITGDIYLLQNDVVPNEAGELKFQILELEPEESYIDTVGLAALDLQPHEHFIADGNLEDSYVFDTTQVTYPVQANTLRIARTGRVNTPKVPYASLAPKTGQGPLLATGDEYVVTIPKNKIDVTKDLYLLVDSEYRDWSLGEQVPFSFVERTSIKLKTYSRQVVMTVVGLAMALPAIFSGGNPFQNIRQAFSIPYTYADTLGCVEAVTKGAANCPSHSGVGGAVGSSRSLVISAGGISNQTYLQTLFPRYVQAAQEVVKIPADLIKGLKDSALTVTIKATKRHRVNTAFVFQGQATTPQPKPLTLTSAVHERTQADYTASLTEQNENFLHTQPGDVVDLTFKSVPQSDGTNRRYLLTSNGFYTKLSKAAEYQIGTKWLSRLSTYDRGLLKRLRLRV